MNITIIAALDKNHLIGANNRLPWHLPADLAHFKKLTKGKPVIMGRKTHQSIGKILPNRLNIVLTKKQTGQTKYCHYFSSLPTALQHCENYSEVMVIGGQSVFETILPVTNKMHLTLIHHAFTGDTYFPHLNKKAWTETERQDFMSRWPYSFITLERV